MDVDHGFYMAKFELLEDRDNVSFVRLFNEFLSLFRSDPLNPKDHYLVFLVLIWCTDESFLLLMVLVVSQPIKVDNNNLTNQRRRFASIYMEINLMKLLVG